MKITVFTPAYNRSLYLPKLYESLKEQDSHDFEWLVVDDGSTDDTREIFEKIRANHVCDFPIRYIYKENGGKHTAINCGIAKAQGELFLILDSDDSLPRNAISDIVDQYKYVAQDPTIGGVSGLMAHHDGKQIGSGYPKGCDVASSIEQRYTYNVTGDVAEVFKTTVFREFPFPEIQGERFCPEQLVWFRIAQKYKLKCFNKIIYYRDYLDGGLTDNIVRIRMNSPVASMMCYSETNKLDNIPFLMKIKAAINYWRFRFCHKGNTNVNISNKWCFVIPFAYIMHIKDLKTKKQ